MPGNIYQSCQIEVSYFLHIFIAKREVVSSEHFWFQLFIILPGERMSKRISESKKAVIAWLELIDAGQYTDGWDNTGEIFRDAISCADWEQKIQTVRDKVGAVQNRKESKSFPLKSVEGLPDGDYIVNEFKTVFADGGSLGERVTTVESTDGSAQVIGYYIIWCFIRSVICGDHVKLPAVISRRRSGMLPARYDGVGMLRTLFEWTNTEYFK